MHFIDYFPHRELGVVLLHQGLYDEALREIEASLAGEKSAKAELYLDSVRKTLILLSGRDIQPPEVLVDSPRVDELTNLPFSVVSGTVRDDTYVRSVLVDGKPVRIDLASREVPFRVRVPLEAGDNLIQIAATDLAGKTTVAERTLRVDREGPVIEVDEPLEKSSRRGGKGLRLKGFVYDDSGLREIKVNGRVIMSDLPREARLDYPVPEGAGEHPDSLEIEARDRAGNVTRAQVRLSSGTGGLGRRLVASLDFPVPALLASAETRTDNLPPVIELRNWTSEQTVYLDQAYIEGSVRDETGVESLIINGRSILRKPGKSVYFGHLAILDEGENLIRIEAGDAAGNRIEKEVRIHRKVRKVHELGSRLNVAFLPLERKNGPGLAGGALEDILLGELVERGRFAMVERQRLEEVLREQKLTQTELVDQSTAVRLGRIVAANSVLLGSMLEKEKSIEIYVRLVDTETSLVVAAVDVYGEDIDAQALRQLCKGLVFKLCDEVPMAEGLVVQVKNERIIVDLGKESRIKKGMRLIIFQEGEPVRHPVTGAVLGTDIDEVGLGLIQAVHDQMSDVQVPARDVLERVKPMQKVITQ